MSQWLNNVRKILSPSSSLLLLANCNSCTLQRGLLAIDEHLVILDCIFTADAYLEYFVC